MGLLSKLSGVKPGLKTTELVVAVVFGISNFLVSIHAISTGLPAADRPEVQAAAAIAVALIVAGYALARGIAKHNASAPMDVVGGLLHAAEVGDPGIAKHANALLDSILSDVGLSATGRSAVNSAIADLDAHAAQLHAELDKAFTRQVTAVSPSTTLTTNPGSATSAAIQTVESGPAGAWPGPVTLPADSPSAVSEV